MADLVEPARILVAEDEDSVRYLLERALTLAGHKVTTVQDGADALVELARHRFDLLLTDIRMPRVDGITLALKTAKDYPTVRILMMTGFADEKQRAHGMEFLSHEVIAKPFALPNLLRTVEAVLQRPVAAL
ncbi:response regulator [Roseiterribacter gracilis]|uniref:Response regulator n=1 Tax=Roseiterribacter gracilis TaxID=2812848 RepID=A0A8S8XB08_9PROT|nr:response regulator [Rhodospirillales bacterium TMPK1]